MSAKRILVVGNHSSVNVWVNEQDLPEERILRVTGPEVLRGVVEEDVEKVVVTYGWREMPSSRALAIADKLAAIGISRQIWRYV